MGWLTREEADELQRRMDACEAMEESKERTFEVFALAHFIEPLIPKWEFSGVDVTAFAVMAMGALRVQSPGMIILVVEPPSTGLGPDEIPDDEMLREREEKYGVRVPASIVREAMTIRNASAAAWFMSSMIAAKKLADEHKKEPIQ